MKRLMKRLENREEQSPQMIEIEKNIERLKQLMIK